MARPGFQFEWDVPPSSSIGKALMQRAAGLRVALTVLAAHHAALGEAGMKERAGWTDRTAFARASLFGRAEDLTIYLGTTNDEYGTFLELGTSRMAPFPTIGPQLEETSVNYFQDAQELASRVLIGGR